MIFKKEFLVNHFDNCDNNKLELLHIMSKYIK